MVEREPLQVLGLVYVLFLSDFPDLGWIREKGMLDSNALLAQFFVAVEPCRVDPPIVPEKPVTEVRILKFGEKTGAGPRKSHEALVHGRDLEVNEPRTAHRAYLCHILTEIDTCKARDACL